MIISSMIEWAQNLTLVRQVAITRLCGLRIGVGRKAAVIRCSPIHIFLNYCAKNSQMITKDETQLFLLHMKKTLEDISNGSVDFASLPSKKWVVEMSRKQSREC